MSVKNEIIINEVSYRIPNVSLTIVDNKRIWKIENKIIDEIYYLYPDELHDTDILYCFTYLSTHYGTFNNDETRIALDILRTPLKGNFIVMPIDSKKINIYCASDLDIKEYIENDHNYYHNNDDLDYEYLFNIIGDDYPLSKITIQDEDNNIIAECNGYPDSVFLRLIVFDNYILYQYYR